jgi:hypothetical protein
MNLIFLRAISGFTSNSFTYLYILCNNCYLCYLTYMYVLFILHYYYLLCECIFHEKSKTCIGIIHFIINPKVHHHHVLLVVTSLHDDILYYQYYRRVLEITITSSSYLQSVLQWVMRPRNTINF